jgi:hypothetical protein
MVAGNKTRLFPKYVAVWAEIFDWFIAWAEAFRIMPPVPKSVQGKALSLESMK